MQNKKNPKHTCSAKSLNFRVRHLKTSFSCLFCVFLRGLFENDLVSFCVGIDGSMKVKRWHNTKRKLKSVEHHQLSILLSVQPQNPVGLPEPTVAKPSFFCLRWTSPAAWRAACVCHFRPCSMFVMSAVLFKRIYTWTSPCVMPPCKRCRIDFYAGNLIACH